MSVLLVGARFCRRRHALLLVDPPHGWQTVQQALDGLADWPFHSADALMFFPRIFAHDRLQGRGDVLPAAAAAIGALLRDADAAVWREPAEPALLRPSAGLTVWVDRVQRARLAQRGVNALRATRTPAREILPACTLAGELGSGADARLLSVRRLALLVAASIERGTRWVTIEGNTARSRERVCRQVEQFLRQLAEDGAFAGTERNRHYFVICDQRLNGPAEQAEGLFRLVYGYQSAHGASRLCWLVEHRAGGSQTRPVSLNQLAALELKVG
jgi:phage tail sheath protein FI